MKLCGYHGTAFDIWPFESLLRVIYFSDQKKNSKLVEHILFIRIFFNPCFWILLLWLVFLTSVSLCSGWDIPSI